jgi:hypothetical protein
VLVSNHGSLLDEPQTLPAIGTMAIPLRFLDFLIYDAIPAAMLHDGGVLVNVPRPERYALHKLIVSRRRREGAAKIDKDVAQAEILLGILAERRKADLARRVGRAARAGAEVAPARRRGVGGGEPGDLGSGSRRWSTRSLQDEPRQVRPLHEAADLLLHVRRVDPHRLAAAVGGGVAHLLQQLLEHGLEPAGADVLDLAVDVVGEGGQGLDGLVGELQRDALGGQEGDVLLDQARLGLDQDAGQVVAAERLELDPDRQAALEFRAAGRRACSGGRRRWRRTGCGRS